MSGDRHRDPQYLWSAEEFIQAEIQNHTQYFIDSIITHMPRVQRLLKRSPRSFRNFSAYAGACFRECRPLQELWALVWTSATIGRPALKAHTAKQKRYRRYERLGLSPVGFEKRQVTDSRDLKAALKATSSWEQHDDDLHARVATCAGPIGCEPPTPTI